MTLARRLPVVLAALAALSTPALAGDVRPPNNAAGPGPATGGSVSLPGAADIEAPEMNTTMKEKRKRKAGKSVSKSKVQELRELAIDEFGQSSGSETQSEE